jgi:hypothetical protein
VARRRQRRGVFLIHDGRIVVALDDNAELEHVRRRVGSLHRRRWGRTTTQKLLQCAQTTRTWKKRREVGGRQWRLRFQPKRRRRLQFAAREGDGAVKRGGERKRRTLPFVRQVLLGLLRCDAMRCNEQRKRVEMSSMGWVTGWKWKWLSIASGSGRLGSQCGLGRVGLGYPGHLGSLSAVRSQLPQKEKDNAAARRRRSPATSSNEVR